MYYDNNRMAEGPDSRAQAVGKFTKIVFEMALAQGMPLTELQDALNKLV